MLEMAKTNTCSNGYTILTTVTSDYLTLYKADHEKLSVRLSAFFPCLT